MKLVLQDLNGEPGNQLTAQFDESGGIIGLYPYAYFILPDPERMIARRQSRILYFDGKYCLENLSPKNQFLHNGKGLIAGIKVILQDLDVVRIGGYALLVSLVDDQALT